MKRIIIVLTVCLALAAAANVSYGALAPLTSTDPSTEFLGDKIEMTGTGSLDKPPRSASVDITAADIVQEQAHEEEEGDDEAEKDGEDEDKDDSDAPDRLWGSGKLG